MCTAFVRKGKDIIFGFNMDINEDAFTYDIYATENYFCIGCPADMRVLGSINCKLPSFYRITDGIRKIHGVNSRGVFTSCLNNMNFRKAPFRMEKKVCSIDQLTDDLISGRRSLKDVQRFAEEKEIVTIPTGAVDVPNPEFHSLSADSSGRIMILEPGCGYAVINESLQ